ncbi:MAG TPA: hypothetical protein VK997_07540 [Deferrisomatales bacterium]|nr:hypothetical protein [Deferrisomatales bacterium]
MSSGYLLLRRREARLRRFGLALGVLLALVFHLALFWGPKVGYRPVLEQARVRRVLVARPYEPTPPPPPPQPVPRAEAPAPAAPTPAPKVEVPPPRAAPAPRVAPEPEPPPRAARVPETVPDAGRVVPKTDQDAWSSLLASLEGRKENIEVTRAARRAELDAQAAAMSAAGNRSGAGGQGEEGDGEGYLDSRIRMTVVSYPPSSIEAEYPRIAYPDLRFRRAQLEKGTCRVWYRVWIDRFGKIVRTQLKTPDTEEERKLYAEFVTQVEQSVAEWPFPRQEAEVHIDVFFQIE